MGAYASTVRALSTPAAPDRDNEDAHWVGEGVVVVADGAGLPNEFRAGCRHDVAWFSSALASTYGPLLARRDASMVRALEAALADVRDRHADDCDLAAGSPSSTVVAWRVGLTEIECLALCDSSIVVVGDDGAAHLTDDRLDQLVRRLATDRGAAAQEAAAGGAPAPVPRAADLINTAGGYWIASHDPAVAHRALVTTVPRDEVRHLIAASDGATRAFLELGTHTLEEFATECVRGRLDGVRDDVRAAEAAWTDLPPGEKRHDDLTVVVATVASDVDTRPDAAIPVNSGASTTAPPYRRAMATEEFVPAGFDPPTTLVTDAFRLEPLRPEHNDADLAAWSSSVDHIRSTAGYPDGSWPPHEGMAPERNLADLERHAADFTARKGFTFTVLDPADDDVIGCVYVYPSTSADHDVSVQSWVRASHAHLDTPLADAVAAWIESDWPWDRPDRYGR